MTVKPEHDKIDTQQERGNMNSLTKMYSERLTEVLRELDHAVSVAQQEGLGTLNNSELEIGLEVNLNHIMRKVTEAMTEYRVARCHNL